jgi:hypothetical protein
MSDQDSEQRAEEQKDKGPNLVLIYGLILMGFLIAAVCAALVVLPFYHRR